MLFLLALSASLTGQADALDAYRACARIERDAARLACFDAAAKGDPVLLSREQAASDRARAEAASLENAEAAAMLRAVQEEARRAEERARAAEAALAEAERRAREAESQVRPDEYAAKVEAIRVAPRGELRLLLDNGEIWRQKTSDDVRIDEDDLSEIRTVTIRKAIFGSWRMTLEPLGETIRVNPAD